MKQMKNNIEKWINLRVFNNVDVFNTTTIVLLWLLETTDSKSLTAIITPDIIDEFLARCAISKASYYRSMKELEDKGVITNSHKGTVVVVSCQELRKSGELPFVYKK